MTKLECNTETHKHCPSCEQVKPRTEFYKNRRAYDELQNYCKTCSIAKVRARHQADPAAHAAYNRKWDKQNPEKKKDRALKTRLGAPYGTYERMFKEQNGACKICKTPDPGLPKYQRFHTDHCEQTSQIRGLLCNNCNNGIGRFYHRIDLLEAAIAYLSQTLH